MKKILLGTLPLVEAVVAILLAYPALLNAAIIARTRSSVFNPNRAYFFGMLFGDFLRIVPASLLVWHAIVVARRLVATSQPHVDTTRTEGR